MIIGQRFMCIHPETILRLPSGIEIHKSKFLPWDDKEVATISGPLDVLERLAGGSYYNETIESMMDMMKAVPMTETNNEEEFFCHHISVDLDIPGVVQLFWEKEEKVKQRDKGVSEAPGTQQTLEEESDDEDTFFSTSIICECCDGDLVTESVCSVQGDMAQLAKIVEVGLDVGFRCSKCKECNSCKKGAGHEKMSIMQEKEQDLIFRSVEIDAEGGKAIATLPFKVDPRGMLRSNRAAAIK